MRARYQAYKKPSDSSRSKAQNKQKTDIIQNPDPKQLNLTLVVTTQGDEKK